jgi:hypothetical protein
MNPKTQAGRLFDWLVIPESVIDELVKRTLGMDGDPEALAMLLVPLRETFKRGNPTGAFWTINYTMDAIYRNSRLHYEAEERFEKRVEKMLESRIKEQNERRVSDE